MDAMLAGKRKIMKYTAESYNGTKTGNSGYNFKRGVQIVAIDDTGIRRKVFTIHGQYRTYKSECLKLWEGTAHYKSGLNKREAAEFVAAMEEAKKLAAKMNETQDPTLR